MKEIIVLSVGCALAVALWIGCVIQFIKEMKEGRNKQ